MTDLDRPQFELAFRRMATVFRLRLKPAELDDLTGAYFKLLDRAPLTDVLAAGKACLSASKTFPKPAEWLHALPHVVYDLPADARWMTAFELDEQARAERLRYDDDPCPCVDCVQAGVSDRPLRYVPTVFADTEAKAFNSRRNKLEVVGHWAHGEELRSWYAAREAFFGLAAKFPGLLKLLRRRERKATLALVAATREPGEEG